MSFGFGFSGRSFRGCSPVFPHGALMLMQYIWVSEPILDDNGDPIRDANDEVIYDSGWRWVDGKGLSASDYDSVRAELRSIVFGAGPVLLDAETIITNIQASEYLNCGWELGGNAIKGYFLFPEGTAEATLIRAYRWAGETYSVGHVTFGGESVTFGGDSVVTW